MFIVKIIQNNTMYSVQELHFCIFLTDLHSAIFTSLTVSVYSSISLLNNFFLHLQFSQSKYSPTSHYLSHPQLVEFQINSLLHTPLPINSLHSNLHLSSLQRCLLLQILASDLHLHLYFSCHSMALFHQFLTLG